MKNKTHRIYHGGGEQDWMNIIPVVTSATSKSGEYGGERDKILQNIEQSPHVTEALHQFSELSYNLLVSVYTYWKTLKDKDKSTLNAYLNNAELSNIFKYIDLANFPDTLEEFITLRVLLKSSGKGSCKDPGKTFEVDVFPPEATDAGQPGAVDWGPEKKNKWVSDNVKKILTGKSESGEQIFGNSREIYYLLNELLYRDCPNTEDDAYFKKRYSVFNIFWTIIWWRSIYILERDRKSEPESEHFNLVDKCMNVCQINQNEIDERIDMLLTIYGASNIFQLIKIPDGALTQTLTGIAENRTGPRLSIITGSFEKKINICHMGRPKVVPHIALSSITNPNYRLTPKGKPIISDGVIKDSELVYVTKIKELRESYRGATPLEQEDIKKKFELLGPFIDANGEKWYSCLSECVCMIRNDDGTSGLNEECSVNPCLNTGNFLKKNKKNLIANPSVGEINYPKLSLLELKYMFSNKLNDYYRSPKRLKAVIERGGDVNAPLTQDEIINYLSKTSIPWEMGQWFIKVNPKSISYKVAQQTNQLLATGISNHARLLMDYFSTFTPFTDFNTKKFLTASLLSSLIQPTHHTFSEVMRSIEYLGINYSPSQNPLDAVNELITFDGEQKVANLTELYKTISYQTIIPFLNQRKYNKIQRPEEMMKTEEINAKQRELEQMGTGTYGMRFRGTAPPTRPPTPTVEGKKNLGGGNKKTRKNKRTIKRKKKLGNKKTRGNKIKRKITKKL